MKKIGKVFRVIERGLIKKVEYFNVALYMKLYNRFLKKIGISMKPEGARFIHPSVQFDGKGYELTHIGNDVVISRNVLFLNHDYSLSCGIRSIGEDAYENEAYFLKEIKIEDNVFIGANCTILPGTTIESNCIIGAGSVVKGKFKSNSIICGNPAKKVADLDEWTYSKKENDTFYWSKYGA